MKKQEIIKLYLKGIHTILGLPIIVDNDEGIKKVKVDFFINSIDKKNLNTEMIHALNLVKEIIYKGIDSSRLIILDWITLVKISMLTKSSIQKLNFTEIDLTEQIKVLDNDISYMPIKKAKQFVKSLHLKNKTEWVKYAKSAQKPMDLPVNPNKIYKDSGWKSWDDWLGRLTKYKNPNTYMNFEKAKKIVGNLRIENQEEWLFKYKSLIQNGNGLSNIPMYPSVVYRDKGWVSWDDWLGI